LYNVKWERNFKINKLLSNEDKVRFVKRPKVVIDELSRPLFNTTPQLIQQSGIVSGLPLVPTEGTPLSGFSLPTTYLLTISDDTNWSGSVVGTPIQFPTLGVELESSDILTNKQLIVSTPYTLNGIVQPFTNQPYTASFNYLESTDITETTLSGSFARITITDLTTFVGDVARVKVFRKSQSEVSGYQFTQEIPLESNEILIDLESSQRTQEVYGLFTPSVISEYWVTSSNDLVANFNQDVLYNSVKLDSVGVTQFSSLKEIPINVGIEYTLDFNIRKGGIVQSDDILNVYIEGIRNGNIVRQTFTSIPSSNQLLQKSNIKANIIADEIQNVKLVFSVKGTEWYISDVSLRASQETAFSPDEITFIQPVPRNLQTETFDFKFEFYDINNNYIPVLVQTTKTFSAGNLNRIIPRLDLRASSLYFQFETNDGIVTPIPPTSIILNVNSTSTSSLNFTSQSYDVDNNLLSASQYIGGQYPGLLIDNGGNQYELTVGNFTGSQSDITVQYIQYTVEVDGLTDSIIISKVNNGSEGISGPSLSFRGIWTGSLDYFYDLDKNIRDVVIHPGNIDETYYFAALQNSLNQSPFTGSGEPPIGTKNDYWEYLGKEDYFVAAKIAIFEQSFIKNTLSVGSNSDGSSANIVIAGGRTDPYITVGQVGYVGASTDQTTVGVLGYDKPGIFMGMYDSSSIQTPRFSLKNNLTGSDERYFRWDGSNLEIEAGNIKLDNSGNVTISGSINAFDGTIGRWVIDPVGIGGNLRNEESTIILDPGNPTPQFQFLSGSGEDRVLKLLIKPDDVFTDVSAGDLTISSSVTDVEVLKLTIPTLMDSGSFLPNPNMAVSQSIAVGVVIPSDGSYEFSNFTYPSSSLPLMGNIFTFNEENPTDYSITGSVPNELIYPNYIQNRISNSLSFVAKNVTTGYTATKLMTAVSNFGGCTLNGWQWIVEDLDGLWSPVSQTISDSRSTNSYTDNQSFNLTLTSGLYDFYYVVGLTVQAGKGTSTINPAITTDYPQTADGSIITYLNNSGVANTYLSDNISIPIPNNIIELTSAGLQVTSTSNTFVRIKRFPQIVGVPTLIETGGGIVKIGESPTSWNGIRSPQNISFDNLGKTQTKYLSVVGPGGPTTDITLSVIGTTTVQHLRPTGVYDLGTPSNRWQTIYSVNTLNVSDKNLKNNITESDLGLDFINKLNPVKYHMISEPDESPYHYGLIAQDVNGVVSNTDVYFVRKHIDDGVEGWSIAYSELISPMIKAIQQLSEKVEQLQLKLNECSGSNF
jgi:hypothetical protein